MVWVSLGESSPVAEAERSFVKLISKLIKSGFEGALGLPVSFKAILKLDSQDSAG